MTGSWNPTPEGNGAGRGLPRPSAPGSVGVTISPPSPRGAEVSGGVCVGGVPGREDGAPGGPGEALYLRCAPRRGLQAARLGGGHSAPEPGSGGQRRGLHPPLRTPPPPVPAGHARHAPRHPHPRPAARGPPIPVPAARRASRPPSPPLAAPRPRALETAAPRPDPDTPRLRSNPDAPRGERGAPGRAAVGGARTPERAPLPPGVSPARSPPPLCPRAGPAQGGREPAAARGPGSGSGSGAPRGSEPSPGRKSRSGILRPSSVEGSRSPWVLAPAQAPQTTREVPDWHERQPARRP
uniref:basic proline-rich protein-like n=1 Tax=Jaculus jaculus TaxID=51337 RepID=UPI001E1B04EA|nr:basic proline-rich protein-like [Jaculus jaculus]